MTRHLRGFGRWLTDWRNLATLVAAVLVALLAAVVIDSIQGRRDAMRDLSKAVAELERRGVQVDTLTAELAQTQTSRDTVAEELRALRELLVDRDVIEPRPQQEPGSTGGPPSTSPQAPAGRAPSSPRPAEQKPQGRQNSQQNPPPPAEQPPPPPPEDEPKPPGPLPPVTCDLLPPLCS